MVPVPTVLRTDLLYGYYGCLNEQVAETINHINLFMDSQFNGPDKTVQNILAAKLPTMLDVSYQVFAFPPGGQLRILSPQAEPNLRAYFLMLQSKGALRSIKFIYPLDEPNISMEIPADLLTGITIIKRVAAEFPEIVGVKYVAIYSTAAPYVALDQYDIIGIDNYDEKSGILTGPEYTSLKAHLLPGQKTILVPGGAARWSQDPVPFVNFAETNPEVAIVMPFLWFDSKDGSDSTLGIRSGPLKQVYINAGKLIISASPPASP